MTSGMNFMDQNPFSLPASRILRALTIVSGCCLVLLSHFANAEEVDKTLAASAKGLVEIVNTRGDITIEGWDSDEIRVTGELDALTEEFIFEVEGDRARIEVRLPKHNVNWGDGSDLVIRLPQGSRVAFDGVSTDVIIHKIGGGVRVRSVSGDVTISEIENQINVKTVSGDIDIVDSSGAANVSSVSGDIELEISSRQITLDTVSGDIEARLQAFEKLRASAVSGDIDVEGKLTDGGSIDISSVSSDVSLELDGPVNAKFNAQTGPGGDIVNDLNDDEVVTKFPAMKGLNTEFGNGAGEINLRTVSGDIRIEDGS